MDSGAIHLMGSRETDAVKVKKGDAVITRCPLSTNVFLKRLSLTFVVLLILDIPGQAEVAQLHALWTGHQHIPNSDVSAKHNATINTKSTYFRLKQ